MTNIKNFHKEALERLRKRSQDTIEDGMFEGSPKVTEDPDLPGGQDSWGHAYDMFDMLVNQAASYLIGDSRIQMYTMKKDALEHLAELMEQHFYNEVAKKAQI